jgi:hypothetical protein
MNAPPFPLNPTIGARFGNWMWNGSMWVCTPASGVRVNTVVFRAPGPYMPSAGLVTAVVEAVGGGGGGAGIFLPTADYAGSGGGGGSGGYSKSTLAAALVLGGVNVVIGQGGAVSEIVGAAPAGTATSFGAMVVANGGGGGISATTTSWGGGGVGASPGVGDLTFPGSTGQSGYLLTPPIAIGEIGIEAGSGAPSFFGGGVRGGGNQGTTQPGPSAFANSGAGGAGAWQNWVSVATATAGGAGGSGICIVTEYCWADSGDSGCDSFNVNARVAVEGQGGWSPHAGQGGWDD